MGVCFTVLRGIARALRVVKGSRCGEVGCWVTSVVLSDSTVGVDDG